MLVRMMFLLFVPLCCIYLDFCVFVCVTPIAQASYINCFVPQSCRYFLVSCYVTTCHLGILVWQFLPRDFKHQPWWRLWVVVSYAVLSWHEFHVTLGGASEIIHCTSRHAVLVSAPKRCANSIKVGQTTGPISGRNSVCLLETQLWASQQKSSRASAWESGRLFSLCFRLWPLHKSLICTPGRV